MRRAATAFTLAAALGGCGTLVSLDDDHHRPAPFGGVATDGVLAVCSLAAIASVVFAPLGALGLAVALADLPLSLVADTALLPYTAGGVAAVGSDAAPGEGP